MNKNKFEDFESGIKKKLDCFDGKLSVFEEMVRGISTLIKMKKAAKIVNQRPRKRSFMSYEHHKEKSVMNII